MEENKSGGHQALVFVPVMFFRRGRLRAKKARVLLIELFNHRYQWPLRMPIAHLLARGDPLRFLCSLQLLVDQVGRGVYLLNRRQPPQQMPWLGADWELALAVLPIRPANLNERLAFVMRLDDPPAAEVEIRRLLLEIIDLAPREKRRREETSEQPLLPWLPRVADLEAPSDVTQAHEEEQADLMQLARRAVRIVWRLPGSRLVALTGSVAAGYADLTSDIDISLFGLGLPQAQVRRSLIAATSDAPDDITQLTQKNYAADTFWLKGRLVDVRYFLIEQAQQLIAHPSPESWADQELLAYLSTADVLVDYEFRGPDLLHELQQATHRARPERMASTAARLNQEMDCLEAASDGPGIFYATVQAIRALFQLLAARNDRWIVLPKWTSVWLDSLEHAPADAHRRLGAIALFPSHPENVAARLDLLRALAAEVDALRSL